MSGTITKRTPDQLIQAIKTSDFGRKAQLVGELCDAVRGKLERSINACGQGLSYDRVRNAVMRLAGNAKNAKLFECDPVSLIAAVNEAAGYGWEVGGVLSHAYLVPYGSTVTMQPGYKGLIDLCHRAGSVESITVESVREGDEFRHVLGEDERIEHKPSDDPQRHTKDITHVYVIYKLKGGGRARCVMTRAAIDAHKEKYSPGWNRRDSAWMTAWEQMAKKTVLKQPILRGQVPMTLEMRRIVEREETQSPETFDVSFTVAAEAEAEPKPEGGAA